MQVVSLLPSTTLQSARRASHPVLHGHPLLSQQSPPAFPPTPTPLLPVIANTSPALPLVPILPPQIAHLRGQLKRRRSSYPPGADSSPPANQFPWLFGGTPLGLSSAEFGDQILHSGFGQELAVPFQPDGSNQWDGLLDFNTPISPVTPASEPAFVTSPSGHVPPASSLGPQKRFKMLYRGDEIEPSRLVQFGSDLAWKTILGSMVEVEGVGQVGVARVLSEIWKRGGGDLVSAEFLWPSILDTLLNSADVAGPSKRIAPSTQAALALQDLYNMTLRPWESSIFSGLLTSFGDIAAPSQMPGVANQLFGISVETPAAAGNLAHTAVGLDSACYESSSNLPDDNLFTVRQGPPFDGSGQTSKDETPINVIEGLEAMLSSMAGAESNADAVITTSVNQTKASRRLQGPLQMPTPEADESPRVIDIRPRNTASESLRESLRLTPAESADSPFASASSSASNASRMLSAVPSKTPPTESVPKTATNRAPHPTLLSMPDAAFIPPPPMCMFFSPTFKDLQKGKVGIWKGQLDVRGIGGGKFSVLIVGEESTGHLWQSNTWPSTISYPQESQSLSSNAVGSCTSTMIPVSHLAREGFTPAAMGMVLCDDEKIQDYVAMVQGLHAEGVAFHLHNAGHLPLVFLPAKFDSSDTLQRLGVAFMTKPGVPLPPARPSSAAGKPIREGRIHLVDSSKKKRRQSAPAKTIEPYRRRHGASVSLKGAIGETPNELDD